MFRKKTIFVFSILFFSSIFRADASESLSLDTALEKAFYNNPKILAVREEINASKGRWLQAEALPSPEAEIEIGGLKRNEGGDRKGEIGSFGFKAIIIFR